MDKGKTFERGKGEGAKGEIQMSCLSCGVETSRRGVRNPLLHFEKPENTGVLCQRRPQSIQRSPTLGNGPASMPLRSDRAASFKRS